MALHSITCWGQGWCDLHCTYSWSIWSPVTMKRGYIWRKCGCLCVCGWGENESISFLFLRIFNCSIATQRRMRCQFKGVEKADFITRNFQPESSNKNLGWFSLVTSQGHLPYSQLNHDYVTSVYSCSNFSPVPKLIKHQGFIHLSTYMASPLPMALVTGKTSRLQYTISSHKSFLDCNALSGFFLHVDGAE